MTAALELKRDVDGRLVLSRPGHADEVGVGVRRAFPWSSPGRYVSLRSSEGREIVLIEDLDDLPRPTRRLIDEELEAVHFVPRILRVVSVDVDERRWRVETDRGPTEIEMQDREDIQALPDGRFLVRDLFGNVHELPRLDALDPRSRRLVYEMV